MNDDTRNKITKIGAEINRSLAESNTLPEIVEELKRGGYTIDLTLEVIIKRDKSPDRQIVTVKFTEEEEKFFAQYEKQMKPK